MLKNMVSQKKDDVCPNCGKACFETDVLCPHCGKNLDELFEQLPDSAESYGLIQLVTMRLSFLNWFTPLFLTLSPLLICLVVTLSFARYTRLLFGQSPFTLIGYVVPSVIIASSSSLIFSVFLFLCIAFRTWMKLDFRLVIVLAILFSSWSILNLWTDLQTSQAMSALRSAAFLGVDIIFPSHNLAYAFSFGAIVLVLLNLITVIGQANTA
jgi:hypothetical protein